MSDSKYNIALALPQHPNHTNLETGGATRSMRSICLLLEKYGPFKLELYDKPDVLISYNNSECDFKIREEARRQGIKIVYSFRNVQQSFGHSEKIDSFFGSSRFVSQYYKGRFGISSEVLPLPMIEEDVIAKDGSKDHLTIINCCPEKGLYLIEAILIKLWQVRKDIPVLIIESRGKVTPQIRKYGLLKVCPSVDVPRNIYGISKALIFPSLWEEPAGRVIAESLLNGLPFAYSGTGGTIEVANGGGSCLSTPKHITPELMDHQILSEEASKWVRWICRCWDDKDAYNLSSQLNLEAGNKYLERNVAPLYVNYFRSVIEGRKINKEREEEEITQNVR